MIIVGRAREAAAAEADGYLVQTPLHKVNA